MAERRLRVEHLMGTVFSFDLRDPELSDRTVDDAVAWLRWVDATFSTYRADSAVTRLNGGATILAECPVEVTEIFDLCARIGNESAGYFSARFGGRLDPTGLVKGWSVERASAILSEDGSRAHAVNGGGDIRTVGSPAPGRSWQIGVIDPFHRQDCLAVIEGTDLAVATSGMSERGAHIINPFIGEPATALASVTVYGPDLTFADAYATAAVAMGPAGYQWLTERTGYGAIVVAADGSIRRTAGYPLTPDGALSRESA